VTDVRARASGPNRRAGGTLRAMPRTLRALPAVVAATLVVACRRERHFEAVCQVIRRTVVERTPDGRPLLLDVELEYDACPGDQLHLVRGGAAFARCMARYADGDLVPVRLRHWWDTRGYYTWDIYQVGACARPIEPDGDGSFARSQECRDHVAYGHANGLYCRRRPRAGLVSVCPWTRQD
jgi:hypothetical protein